MSLLLNASEWKNDNVSQTTSNALSKSSQKATGKTTENFQELNPASVEYQQNTMDKRAQRVNDLLNKLNVENDGDKLMSFNPPPKPVVQQKNDETMSSLKPDELMPKHPTQEILPNIPKNRKGLYVPNDLGKNLSHYGKSYEPSSITFNQNKPYYANMGIGGGQGGLDNKLIEKINYMIHLLEEQQDEKTNNVTEEFVLYSLFGVFIIFVLDSFARSGKYVR
jgi:hypothetical protein